MNALKTETEQKIIEAAREIFIEKGMQGARMQEIADRAGINKALLHYYFRSKEKLFDAVFEESISKVLPEFAKLLNSSPAIPDMIRHFITFYNDFFRQNPFMPQFFFHEIWQHPDKLAAYIKSQKVNPTQIVANLKAKMPFEADTEFLPQHMIANVMGMCLFPHIARPLFQRIFFENETQYDAFLSERTELLIAFLNEAMQNQKADIEQKPDEDF
jgi:TetR/AcrR family transcriptional regulator